MTLHRKRFVLTHAFMFVFAMIMATTGLVIADSPKESQAAFKGFLSAFADGDTKAMSKFYAPEVTVKRGSTILDKNYGDLGGEDGDDKDQTVKRAKLLKAYELAMKALGGKKDWKVRGADLKKAEVLYVDNKSKEEVVVRKKITADRIWKIFGVKEGDVLAIVNPKGDMAVFQLRKIKGKWLVVGEMWD